MIALAPALLWSMVLLPAIVGAVLAVNPRAERIAAPVAISTAAATVGLAVAVSVVRPSVSVPFVLGTDFALAVDTLSALLVPTIAFVAASALLVATGEIGDARPRFYGLMLLFAAVALITATATTLPTLLFAWELMGAASYALIGFWWRDDHRVSAGLTAFVTTRSAAVGLYVAAAAALAGGAGLALGDLADASPGWRHVIAAGVLVAAMGKAAQLPFSFWLSSAMAGPSPVSALLHSAAMVAMGGYLLLRVEPLLAVTGWAGPVTAWIGAATALLLGAVALAQRDLKQLLAASTCAQLGFVVLAAGVGSVAGGATHLVAHAATKALLFLAAGLWLTALGTKALPGLRGAGRRRPLLGVATGIGAVSLAGLAPLSMWATKDEILAAALEDSIALYVVGLAAAALSAGYAAKILVVVWRRASSEEAAQAQALHDSEQQGTREVPAVAYPPLAILATGAVVLGVLALGPWGEALGRSLDGPDHPSAGAVELVISAVLALIMLGAVFRWGAPEPRWARGWLGLEAAARGAVVTPTLRLADALARFDDRVLDAGVMSLSGATLRVAQRAGRFDDRVLDGTVGSVSAGALRAADRAGRFDDRVFDGAVGWVVGRVRSLGALARRPQTGQLHHYYLQVVAVLAVGFLLLLLMRG